MSIVCLFLRNRGFCFSDTRYFEPLGRFENTDEFDGSEGLDRFDAAASAEVFGRGSLLARALLVFPLGTLTSQALACASEIEPTGVPHVNSERQEGTLI
jgi:hypothetical protein